MKMYKKDFGIFETESIPNEPDYQFTILQYPNTKRETDRTYGFSSKQYPEVKKMFDSLPDEFHPQMLASELAKIGVDVMGIGRVSASQVL